ncbi:hypothetical protein CXK86_20290 [Paenibacillus sp. BGI2013]|uniref:hypothetical protein n=1 Tax=Paenibacillus sp. BGI2013 TaxID=2058902 RepID=UPI000C6E80CA|nr:hypothetical protein [Paenibacillus sp. BGI2013]PKQ89390.1 hypothetical protein CXK86_20290 [Paenibacillus sp. BGI2013]
MAYNLNEIVQIKREIEKEWSKKLNVNNIDIGLKYVGGKLTDRIAIRVYVDKKENVSPKDEIPSSVSGIPTDVIEKIETFELRVLEMSEEQTRISEMGQRFDPLCGGIQIGPCRKVNGNSIRGTLGAIVQTQEGKLCALSNFHVLCVDTDWKIEDAVAQPVDIAGCPTNMAGNLLSGTLYGKFGKTERVVDAAIAEIKDRNVTSNIPGIGKITGFASPEIGSRVRKVGMVTGLTYGKVEGGLENMSVIPYGHGIGDVTFKNSIRITADKDHNEIFSQNGDSGAIIVNEHNQAVGLLFAGTTDNSITLANDIQEVKQTFQITMYGGDE